MLFRVAIGYADTRRLPPAIARDAHSLVTSGNTQADFFFYIFTQYIIPYKGLAL